MEKNVSYLRAFLLSEYNQYLALSVLGVGALASFPFGWVGLGVSLVALGVIEALACLVVPDLPSWRAAVDRNARKASRNNVRGAMFDELAKRTGLGLNGRFFARDRSVSLESSDLERMKAYNRMVEQIDTLSRVANDRESTFGEREVERLHEASLDFLSLWLASKVIEAREENTDLRDVRRKLSQVEAALQNADRASSIQLRRAAGEYQGILKRRDALVGKTVAIDAALLAMPDKVEEIYQMVIAAPYSKALDGRLEDSLSRLRLAEELEQELSFDLSDTLPSELVFSHAQPVVPASPVSNKERNKKSTQQSSLT